MSEDTQLSRADVESCQHFGSVMALEVAVLALLAAHSDRAKLKEAWEQAETRAAEWFHDVDPRVREDRAKLVRDSYLDTLDRLRDAGTAD